MYDTVNLVRVIGFDRQEVEEQAIKKNIHLTDKHWEVIKFMKKFYDYHEDEELKITDYNNALRGKYSKQGGLKYLYSLFPSNPVNILTQLVGIPAKTY